MFFQKPILPTWQLVKQAHFIFTPKLPFQICTHLIQMQELFSVYGIQLNFVQSFHQLNLSLRKRRSKGFKESLGITKTTIIWK